MSTETTSAPAVGDRQIGQLLAGRYRLSLFHGGDDLATVWRALDETTQLVVTLEILRDARDDAVRQRFVSGGHRLEQVERPSVMRVAAIHDDAPDTFIVFEHLVPLPVVLTALEKTYDEAKPLAAVTAPVAPTPADAPAAAPLAAAVTTTDLTAPAAVQTSPEVTSPPLVERGDGETIVPSRITLLLSMPLVIRLRENAQPYLEEARSLWQDIRAVLAALLARVDLGAVRAHLPSGVNSALNTAVPRLVAQARRVRAIRPPVGIALPHASMPHASMPHLSAPRVVRALRAPRAPRAERAARAPRANPLPKLAFAKAAAAVRTFVARLRPPILLLRAIALALVAVALFASPLGEAILGTLTSPVARAPSLESAAPSTLSPAAFDLPPLGAYGAAFESQAAYPMTSPSGAVEWVVALRNTGSVGWYRGIDGAQASLALSDGTAAAVQSTPYVGPGQVGWFVARFRAPAEPGTYTVTLRPRIDGRGQLPDLGIFTVVTVTKTP